MQKATTLKWPVSMALHLGGLPATVTTTGGGTVTIDPDGTFTYTPIDIEYFGTDTFTYTVVDDGLRPMPRHCRQP